MIKKVFISSIATFAILLYSLVPTAYAIEITGNGTGSTNDVVVTNNQENNVVQNNDTVITNTVTVSSNTGLNQASGNTGGDVSVDTGNSDVNTTVKNAANANVASVECCQPANTTTKISDNGSDSTNSISLDNNNLNNVFQDNAAIIQNSIDVASNTGLNDASNNTGGDSSIKTGNAKATTEVSNAANLNAAKIGKGSSVGGGSNKAEISGNGTGSDNSIVWLASRENNIVQDNFAVFDNLISINADSGLNFANDNTGGDVRIDTGNVDTKTRVENLANLNWAKVMCGECLLGDISAKISGNGSFSTSSIVLDSANMLNLFQGGEGSLTVFDNEVNIASETGLNEADDNTGDPNSSSSDRMEIRTGDADNDTEIKNKGGVNLFGVSMSELPKLGDLSFTFNLHDLLEMVGHA